MATLFTFFAVGAAASASAVYGPALLSTAFRKATNKKSQPRHDSTTVVIGGGVIGLSTAYHLAIAHRESNSPHRIVILEARESLFTAASSHNSGCLAYDWLPDPLKSLGEYSFEIWRALAKSSEFVEFCGYRERCLFEISFGNGNNVGNLPNWLKTEPHWDARLEPTNGHSASINPLALGKWLEMQCTLLGVEIHTEAEASEVIQSEHNELKTVVLANNKGTVECQNLVIAAGPWTPGVLRKLFPDWITDIKAKNDSGDWLIFENPQQPPERPLGSVAGIFFDEVVGEKLEITGRHDGTIWICGEITKHTPPPPYDLKPSPDQENLKKLRELAERFIKSSQTMANKPEYKLQIRSKGRDFRPSPEVRASINWAHRFSGTGGRSDAFRGVFLNYGHGMYGISLSMGSGKLLSQIIRNEKTDIAHDDFTPLEVMLHEEDWIKV